MSGHPQERDEQAELVRLRNELVRVRVQTEKDRFDKETARIVLKRTFEYWVGLQIIGGVLVPVAAWGLTIMLLNVSNPWIAGTIFVAYEGLALLCVYLFISPREMRYRAMQWRYRESEILDEMGSTGQP